MATSTEFSSASRTGWLVNALPHHSSEKPATGQLAIRAELNEFSTTSIRGMYRKARMIATITPRTILDGRESLNALTNGVGRVVVSTDPRCATGDSVRGSRLAELPRISCEGVALDVIVEHL